MNIMTIMILLALIEELPELPNHSRANRFATRDRAIAHNKAVYHALVGHGLWYENKNEDGKYASYHRGKVVTKEQEGRWATERISGHRRFQKWSRDYYPSFTNEKARQRWEEALKDYFD